MSREDRGEQFDAHTLTLEAYLDSDLGVPATAARLSVRLNTVRYRLERIEQLTGLDARRFWDLAELAAAHRILTDSQSPRA